MRKLIVLIVSTHCLVSACSSSYLNQRYAYVDKEREWEMELVLKADSTFLLRDNYGCIQMRQRGTFKRLINNSKQQTLVLSDTTRVEVRSNVFQKKRYSYLSNVDYKQYMFTEDQYFPLVSLDTVYVLDDRRVLFRGMTFERFHGNLQKRRIRLVERFYIERFGKDLYIKSIGEGISVKRARENLKKCRNSL